MKRRADNDTGLPFKRIRRIGDEEVRLLIPSKVAGSIIGKGGQNITQLRSQYKASITVPDCPGPERLLNLSSDMESICNIIRDVIPNLEENGAKIFNSSDIDLRMMVHQSQAGCIIGKGGSKIKEIRERMGTKIKIFSNLAPQSTERVIQIVGEPDKCINTVREVLNLIKLTQIKGVSNPYDPHNFDEYYADEYGGWGGSANHPKDNRDRKGPPNYGRSGARGNPGGGTSRSGRDFGPRPPRGGNRGPMREDMSLIDDRNRYETGAGGGGSGICLGSGGGSSLNRNANYGNRSGGSRTGGGGNFVSNQASSFGGGNRQNNGWSPGNGSFNQDSSSPNVNNQFSGNSGPIGLAGPTGPGGKTSNQVTIPKELAGAIIGKGGTRIRKIRQESGAGITIDEPLPGTNERIITISGTNDQIQMAQYLLQQRLDEIKKVVAKTLITIPQCTS